MEEVGSQRAESSTARSSGAASRSAVPPSLYVRRRIVLGLVILATLGAASAVLFRDDPQEVGPEEMRGSPSWALEHYGDPDSRGYRRRNITTVDFLGRTLFIHKATARHFLRLERIFLARAPAYAAGVATGEVDDWSYINRNVRGGNVKSSHAFGIAIDINALANPLGTAGDMPDEVVRQWEAEGGDWGGDWSRPDPMHFETHLTPAEIRHRYRSDGTPRDWYLTRLTGG